MQQCAGKQVRNQGFTLLEVLLVILVIALTAVSVTLSLPNREDQAIRESVDRFQAVVQLIKQEAVWSSREFGIHVQQGQYQILQFNEGKWQSYALGRLGSEVTLPDDIELSLVVEGFPWQNINEKTWNTDDAEEQLTPQVLLLSSGEITPFEVQFQSGEIIFTMKVKTTGELTIETPNGQLDG